MFAALKQRLFGGSKASGDTARSRLHFVLVQDRTGLTNEEMAKFKEEMVSVIEKFFVIERDGFDITYRRDQETTTLQIHSPVLLKRDKATGKVKELPISSRKDNGRKDKNWKDREKDSAKIESIRIEVTEVSETKADAADEVTKTENEAPITTSPSS